MTLYPSSLKEVLLAHGNPMSDINPGSEEMRLAIKYIDKAFFSLKDGQIGILGGDLLIEEGGRVVYTGDSWHCDRSPGETSFDFVSRSIGVAMQYLQNIQNKKNSDYKVVLVCEDCEKIEI